jgi:hypothetical protein
MSTEARLAAITANQHALIRHQQARDVGLTYETIRWRVALGQWTVPVRGVYEIAGAPPDARRQVLAHVLASGPGAVASHRAAAELWRLPGFPAGSSRSASPAGAASASNAGGSTARCGCRPTT